MALAAADFDVFVTIDQNLQHQQDLENAAIGIVVLQAATSRFDDLEPLVPRLLEALRRPVPPGELVRVEA